MNSQGLGGAFDRDREREREREMDEQRHRAALQQQDEIAHREREQREQAERQHREPYQPGAPHHSSAGSIPLHQPVAARMNAIHSPGGLLANHGGSTQTMPIGASSGPPSNFGGPIHNEPGRPPQQQQQQHNGPGAVSGPGPQHQMHQIFAPIAHGPGGPNTSLGPSNGPTSIFGGPLQQQDNARPSAQEGARAMQQMPFGGPAAGAAGHQAPPGPGAVAQGQQPILNDALSYLDQVKVQFHEQPDVYNRFLDIMKDFKSQTIDTPGVISRVSELFAGHPNLIQGFNTFLPPGYRIECGLENNPNSIRVTTPSGSTIHSIGGARPAQPEPTQPAPVPAPSYINQRPGVWQQQQQPQQQVQHSVESPEANFSVPAPSGPAAFPGSGQSAPFEANSPNQQRAAPATQSGQAASHAQIPRNAHTPTPVGGPNNMGSGASQQATMEKRAPVEFNHAISYVNKIKNRFQDKPEIYKQFLEILQTYQREQKPIQDVYSQVTTLFHTAPDLLEDFKQFLPESAAHARAVGARLEDGMNLGAAPSAIQPGQPTRDGPKMPPVGNFAPPASAGKENKKRPRTEKTAPISTTSVMEVPTSAVRGSATTTATGNKRAKLSHKPGIPDGPAIEPTLTPTVPEPLGPIAAVAANHDDLTFFDRAKKHIANRTTMNEFIKLLNLYVMDLITGEVLVHKATNFIGANSDLMNWLKSFLHYTGEDEVVDNVPDPRTGRVSLSNCRGYGPSYRLLPKRERLKTCSGRDELCNSVLNDEWASHPTWASEDSGFVAHRKNGYEEGLHRIEEERHDYDFYIEANQKCIQLLEPVAQQMLTLPLEERANYQLPVGLGGQSASLYKRVLKKIYGPDKGVQVAIEMVNQPFSVVPIVMARLKQKDEEWRFTQREWEKVWQGQTENMHLKSLDHMGIQVKSNDKRNLSAKHLVDAIKTKHEEQQRARVTKGKIPRHQFQYTFSDQDAVLDLLRLMTIYATVGGQHNAMERRRILEFFETFIPQFFDLPEEMVHDKLVDIDQDSAEEEEDEAASTNEQTNGRPRRNGKKSDLLRGVLDPGRNGSRSRTNKEESAASGSKETTPDVGSANEDDTPDAAEDAALPEVSNDRWLPTVPRPTVVREARNRQHDPENSLLDVDGELKADAPFPRSWYNFYCNQNIFVFFSVFRALYKRLVDVKNSPESVMEEIRRQKAERPAKTLGLASEDMEYFDARDPGSFWQRTLDLIEDYINGEIDEARYQDVLRHYYLKNGWTLYTIQDLLKTLCRVGLSCNNPDTKGEKTKELVREYLSTRHQEETSYQTEISARKFAEKCIKDGEMFVICWYPAIKEATLRWLQKDETTFYTDEMELKEQWQYYISSYMRIEHTEGVVRSRLQKVLLERNLPSGANDSSDDGYTPKPLVVHEGLVLRICLYSYKIVYEKGTSDYFIYNTATTTEPAEERKFQDDKRVFLRELREEKFKEKMVMNNAWMKNMSREEVQKRNEDYQKWVTDGTPLPSAQDGDTIMLT